MKYLLLLILSGTCQMTSGFADEFATKSKPVDTPAPPATEIKLVEGDWRSVQKIVKDNKGKVVVVDIWSTACLPCMREFPHLLELQEKYGNEIVCLSLNVDYAGIKSKPAAYYRPRVEKFLKRQPSACRSLLCTVDAIELFDELKLTSIPAVYLFGKDGELIKRFDDRLLEKGEEDAFTYEKDINPVVAKVMKTEHTVTKPQTK